MATIRTHNVVEANGEKGTWGTLDTLNRENATTFAVRKPTYGNARTPLYEGTTNGVYHNQEMAPNSDLNEHLPNSESDSLLNLYGDSSTGNLNLIPSREDQAPENMYQPEEYDSDAENWIHRDKLVRIENEELQAAGFRLANQTAGRMERGAQSRDRLADDVGTTEQTEHWASAPDQTSPRTSLPADEGAQSPERKGWDLRTPEEIAETESTPAVKSFGTPVVRKSGSKIPVLTSSPLPIPSERLERETPLPRKRNFSGSLEDGDTLVNSRVRTSGNSVGSPNLLDSDSNNGTPASANGSRVASKSVPTTSPPNARPGTKGTAGATSPPSSMRKITPAGARKTSNPQKPRATSHSSSASPLQRPSTRAGDPDRPKTAINRPEGEAPWLATMYKPDPRLPQDQQIIPTHAKKHLLQQQQQQQQQSNNDDSIPNNHDLRGLSPPQPESEEIKPPSRHPSPSPPTPGTERKEDGNAWPLRPMASVRSTGSSRPGTSGSGTGGYSTMPKVVSSPLNSPPIGSLAGPRSSFVPQNVPQNVPQSLPPDELDKKGARSCGCCIVM